MKTKPNNTCPQCGTSLPSDAPSGLCPACVMAMNLATPTFINEDGSTERVKFEAPKLEEIIPLFQQLELIELLGQGGMGVVYKARQKELDRFVALKILPKEIGETAGFAERFAREARALGKLNHPNIVTLYEFGHVELEDGEPLYYFLMEYVDGLNLRQLLHNGRMEAREALSIVPQICDALQFAHDSGIVHRDIKPENILLDRRGNVKVADFGLAKIVEEERFAVPPSGGSEAEHESHPKAELQTVPGKVMGTPKYMSPEQVEAPGAVDHRADIYALGVVFYQMLTGEMPEESLQPPSTKVNIDVRLDEVVLRALEQKPDLRYQQASILKTSIETIASQNQPDPSTDTPEKNRFPLFSLIITELFLIGFLLPLAFGLSGIFIRPRVMEGLILIGLFGFLNYYAVKKASPETQRRVLKTAAGIITMIWLCALALSLFFIIALSNESGGWNPARSEAFFIAVSMLGSLLLPLCAWYLFKALRTPEKQSEEKLRIPKRVGIATALIVIGTILISLYARKPEIIVSFTNQGTEWEHVISKEAGAFPAIPPNGIRIGVGCKGFQLRDAQIEIKRRIEVTNTGTNNLVILFTDDRGDSRALTLGQNGTGTFSKKRPLKINDVVLCIEKNRPDADAPSKLEQLADNPQKLRKQPTAKIIEAGMTNIKRPWAWQELERRVRDGQLNTKQVDLLVLSFTNMMKQNYPEGYQQPLFSLGDLFEKLAEQNLLNNDDQLNIITHLIGAPSFHPLPRVIEGEETIEVQVHLNSPWDDDLFGYTLLNDLKSIRLDGQVLEIKRDHPPHRGLNDYSFTVKLPPLAAGAHRLECTTESALVPKESTAGLEQQVSSIDWPPTEKRWTRSCSGTFNVYGKTESLVRLVDDPRLAPTGRLGLKVKSVTINSVKNGSAATATVKLDIVDEPSMPVSADVFLTLENKTYRCGRLTAYQDKNQTHRSGFQSTVSIPIPAKSVCTAEITLKPNPEYLERKPFIEAIWNREITFQTVSLNRHDLANRPASTSPANDALLAAEFRHAERNLKLVEQRFNMGEVASDALLSAQCDAEVARAKLEGDDTKIVGIRLHYAEALLEIAEARYNAGRISFSEVERAKLNIERLKAEAARRSAEDKKPASSGSFTTASFQKQQELTITRGNADAQGFVFFGFEDRKWMTPGFNIEHNPGNAHFAKLTEEQWDWIRGNKLDVLFHFGDKNYEMLTLEMQQGFIAQPMEWESITPARITNLFEGWDAKGRVRSLFPAATSGNDYRDGLTSANAFRTVNNLMGAYQIRKINNDHQMERGVVIRYRLIHTPTPPTKTEIQKLLNVISRAGDQNDIEALMQCLYFEEDEVRRETEMLLRNEALPPLGEIFGHQPKLIEMYPQLDASTICACLIKTTDDSPWIPYELLCARATDGSVKLKLFSREWLDTIQMARTATPQQIGTRAMLKEYFRWKKVEGEALKIMVQGKIDQLKRKRATAVYAGHNDLELVPGLTFDDIETQLKQLTATHPEKLRDEMLTSVEEQLNNLTLSAEEYETATAFQGKWFSMEGNVRTELRIESRGRAVANRSDGKKPEGTWKPFEEHIMIQFPDQSSAWGTISNNTLILKMDDSKNPSVYSRVL